MHIPKQFFDLFSGNKRASVVPTLVIAALVTAVVAIPLTIRAAHASDPVATVAPAADANMIVVDTADFDPTPLDRATVSGPVLISFHHPTASGVSFHLLASGSTEPLIAAQDLQGPQFDLLARERGGAKPLDSSLLADGDYELFLTVATGGGEQRTAVTFTVQNS